MPIDLETFVTGVLILLAAGAIVGTWTAVVRTVRGRRERAAREAQRLADEERARREEARRAYQAQIDDTRAYHFDLAKVIGALARGRPGTASGAMETVDAERYPHFRPELVADDVLIDALCAVPEIVEHTGRLPDEVQARVDGLPAAVREAMRLQEERLRSTGAPLLRTPEQHERLVAASDRVMVAAKRYEGVSGLIRGVATALRRW